jgi:hypothetical protein
VEVQERLDGQVVVAYRGKVLTPQKAPPLAAALRAHALTMPMELPEEERGRHPHKPPTPGPLAGDTIWYEDPVRKSRHSQLVRAGMDRAREQGKPMGRPGVTAREGFNHHFADVLARMQSDGLSRRRAAKHLAFGYATLKRLLDTMPSVEPLPLAKENGTTDNAPGVPSPPALPICHAPAWGAKQCIIGLTDKIAEH